MKLVQNSWFKKILMIVCLGAAVAGGWYYFHTPQTNIQEFVESRDMQKILDLFDKNWYWLTPQTREEFDPSVYFKYRTHSHSPAHFGKLLVKVLYEKESFVGFIAYYKEQFYSPSKSLLIKSRSLGSSRFVWFIETILPCFFLPDSLL